MVADSRSYVKELPLRIGLIATGIILFGVALALWSRGQPSENPTALGLSFAAWIAGMAFFVLSSFRSVDSRLSWFILGSLVLSQLAFAYLEWLNYTPFFSGHTDNEMIAEFAVEALKRGQNPYSWNFSDIVRVYRDPISVTPFLDGAFQNRVTYPALGTLILFAFDLLGIGQVRIVSLLFHLALLVLIFFYTPVKLRPIILMPFFILKDFVFSTLGGVQDVVWSALLVGVIVAWKRPILRAVLFGLACSFRQQPWLVAPFILIYLWKEGGTTRERWRRIAVFAGISLGIFMLINLPFIIWDPVAWWLGAFEPIYARFDVINFGLGSISQFGLAPLPREFYTGLQVASLLVMLAIHWRHARAVDMAFWLFPAIFFWFYYRSLPSYWIYWIPPLLFALTRRLASLQGFRLPIANGRARSLRTAAFVGGLVLANLALGFALIRRDSAIRISSSPPIDTISYAQQLAYRLEVDVVNLSEQVITPRFALQRDVLHAIAWEIETGPERLAPGESGKYVISTRTPTKAFSAAAGGQFVVTDAGGDYFLRAILTIPPDPGIKDPDHIANPDFRYWPTGGDAPLGWALSSSGGGSTIAKMELEDGVPTLTLQVTNGVESSDMTIGRLSQTASFPESFAISVFPTGTSIDPTEHAYGLEVEDGTRKLWILFGDSDDLGMLGEDFAYIFIRSPLNTWSERNIKLRDFYLLFGWHLPEFSQRISSGLEFPARQVTLSLLSMPGAGSESPAIFGPIKQNRDAPSSKSLIAEALEYPDTYYVNVGDEYRRQRNFGLAQEAYLRALTYNTLSPGAGFGFAESSFWLGEYDQASAAFVDSIQKEYRVAESSRGAGWSALALGDAELSERFFRSAIEADPNFPDAHNGLGWVFIEQDLCEQAVTQFRRALSLDSRFLEAQRGIEECALREDV